MSDANLKIFGGYEALLAAHGLDSFERLFAFDGGRHVDGHRDRSVIRFELAGDDGQSVALYLKREWNPKPAMLIKRMLSRWGRPPRSRSRAECRNLVALRKRGVATTEPVAVGEERAGPFYRRALLLVREVPDAVNLGKYLEEFPAQPAAEDLAAKRAMAREIAAMVRRMHDSGIAFRDLFAKHVFVSPSQPDGSFRPTLIDAQRARRVPHLWPTSRWGDLAALLVTTNVPACADTDRLRFLLTYARQSRLTPAVRLMMARVARRAEKLRGKGADPQLSRGFLDAPPGMTPLSREEFRHIDRQRIFVNVRHLGELARLGLDTFDKVMSFSGGREYRAATDRLTVRVPLAGPGGKPEAVYLKRHRKVDVGEWLDGLLHLRKPRTPADMECRNIFLLSHFGIATMKPVALGQHLRWTLRQPSFLMTEEIPDGVPADDYLKATFAPAGAANRDAVARKRRFIHDVARLVHRLHRAGFYHRDLYLCHIFVRELTSAAGQPEWGLHLIDLQRVRWPGPGKVGRRWIIKDLAELAYSAPAGVVSRTDRVRFLREYLGLGGRRWSGRLDDRARRLVRSVVRKAEQIARHDARLQARAANK